MGLTSALFTGLSGLNTNQMRLDVIGNNIANVNTTAFKSSRMTFQSQFSQTFTFGTPPGATSGGTNPSQVGLGAVVGAIQRDFSGGSIETTGNKRDLAIEGDGLFILEKPDGSRVYTRDGSFQLSGNQTLVSSDGYYVMGFGVDDDFNIVPGALTQINLPLGLLTAARATANVTMMGNLNSDGDVATSVSVISSQAMTVSGIAATAADTLVSVDGGLFSAGDVLTITGQKGGRSRGTATLTVTAATTVQDLMDLMEDVYGIETTVSNPTGFDPPGVDINASGQIVVTGNIGTQNDITIGATDITSTGANPTPLTMTKSSSANGESVFTQFTVYDSLGSAVEVHMVAAYEDGANNRWRWFAESPDDSDGDYDWRVGTGSLTFTSDGDLATATGSSITIDRTGTGAATPLTITPSFSMVTARAALGSDLVLNTQDGFEAGTLNDFSIGSDGVIVGSFSNGLTQNLGQIALATFSNAEGLVAESDNNYITGPNSGVPVVSAPLSLGAGKIVSGALELSNVDLSREFINLIVASTGFSAASRVISTSDNLLRELLMVSR